MAAKTERFTPLNQLRHVEDFTESQLSVARTTIALHLNHPDNQNTITQSEIQAFARILDRKPSVICEIVNEEGGDIVTMEQRQNMPRRELVEA